ncbi:type II toxin-antitoxin system HicA family toxin [Anabaena azotica]|uniref:Type II toxin-antitoxin system HicA family toxin n=1 Tax=Anabaena azotica FACHB-119 TaxID=947527 RepID=A0ABR8D3Z3_9NOST|nr:type II toxin-antitoxin system HicA family toxin [Anabaena azotica]MBD2500483.1 type II toxin-antitoxin system HicA family toxin [Anabaena azotica FACHB-119]
MSQTDKLLAKILSGTSDKNIAFEQLCQLLIKLGFDERIRGSHHIYTKDGIEEILNLQPKQGKAKAYQVKQVREVILKYQLGGQDDSTI